MSKALLIMGGAGILGAVYAIKTFLETHAVFDLAVIGFIGISLLGVLMVFIYARNQNE